MLQALWKTIWCFLKKLKIELPYDPAIPFLNVYHKVVKAGLPMLIAALFTVAERQK